MQITYKTSTLVRLRVGADRGSYSHTLPRFACTDTNIATNSAQKLELIMRYDGHGEGNSEAALKQWRAALRKRIEELAGEERCRASAEVRR
jgi:hypothetical protein